MDEVMGVDLSEIFPARSEQLLSSPAGSAQGTLLSTPQLIKFNHFLKFIFPETSHF